MILDFKFFTYYNKSGLFYIDICGVETKNYTGSLFYLERYEGEWQYDLFYLSYFF